MSMYAKVRRMHLREKRPISEIARLTSHREKSPPFILS